MRDREWINTQARQFLTLLNSLPFTDCHALTRNFSDVTPRPGLYAFRHIPSGILYIGKSQNVRKRLRGGHKALGWAFIDRLDPNDVRIAVATLDWGTAQYTLDIEARMIQTLRPRYNVQIRQGE
jgi:excinuclease UvrABC nuclease subunit